MSSGRRTTDDSVSHWLVGLKTADDAAVAALWHRYFERLVGFARSQLNGAPRQAADEEDVALSVFKSLCLRSARGEFPKLDDRDDLWRILVAITRRKAAESRRGAGRLKRDFRRIEAAALEQIEGDAPSPGVLAALEDERDHLLAILPDDATRQVALRKMEGDEIIEVAEKLGISPRSVDRKLKLIRVAWTREFEAVERDGASRAPANRVVP